MVYCVRRQDSHASQRQTHGWFVGSSDRRAEGADASPSAVKDIVTVCFKLGSSVFWRCRIEEICSRWLLTINGEEVITPVS